MEKCGREGCGKEFPTLRLLWSHRGGAHGRRKVRLTDLERRVNQIETVLRGARVRVVS